MSPPFPVLLKATVSVLFHIYIQAQKPERRVRTLHSLAPSRGPIYLRRHSPARRQEDSPRHRSPASHRVAGRYSCASHPERTTQGMCEVNIAHLQAAVLRLCACLTSFIGKKLEIFRLGPTSNNQDSLDLRKLPLSALSISMANPKGRMLIVNSTFF